MGLSPGFGRAQPSPAAVPSASVSAAASTAALHILGRAELGAVPVTPSSSGIMPPTMQTRAEAWFTAKDDAGARRTEMRAMTSALKQSCRYCHTPAFDGYTDRLDVSRQMMAISAEHGVTCAECHAGRTEYTELGRKSAQMWQLSHEQNQLCEACHLPNARFEKLSPAGLKFKKTKWKAWSKAHPVPTGPATSPGDAPTSGAP